MVDETVLETNATANFADNFGNTPSYGADGAGTVTSAYTLGVKSAGVDSGLNNLANQDILLYKNDTTGTIEGRVGSTVYFTVSVNSSGTVTLDQQIAIKHPVTPNPDDAVTLSATDLITLTRTDTITDGDGDTQPGQTVDISGAISFDDDVPSITVGANEGAAAALTVSLDETKGDTDRYATDEVTDIYVNDDVSGALAQVTTSVPGGLTSLFKLDGSYGADGPGTTTGVLSFTGVPGPGNNALDDQPDGDQRWCNHAAKGCQRSDHRQGCGW